LTNIQYDLGNVKLKIKYPGRLGGKNTNLVENVKEINSGFTP
jgi:hypothetical protein